MTVTKYVLIEKYSNYSSIIFVTPFISEALFWACFGRDTKYLDMSHKTNSVFWDCLVKENAIL